MDGYRSLFLLTVIVGSLGLGGAGCPQMVQQYTAPQPPALPPSSTLQQVIEVVNRNNSQIHSFYSDEAKLSAPGMPNLRANLAFQRPKHLRLRGETGLTGPELDLGSNDQLFWFWVRRNQPPGVYYCRHDQYVAGAARQTVPIDPDWLIEALGMAELDPALPHQGPFPLAGGRLELRTVRETPAGPAMKVTVVDSVRGFVVEQRLYDAGGRLLASSAAEQHRRDPLTGLVMPRVVKVYCAAAQFTGRIDLGNVRINRLAGNQAEIWTMPQYPDAPAIDLCSPAVPGPAAGGRPVAGRFPRGRPPR